MTVRRSLACLAVMLGVSLGSPAHANDFREKGKPVAVAKSTMTVTSAHGPADRFRAKLDEASATGTSCAADRARTPKPGRSMASS